MLKERLEKLEKVNKADDEAWEKIHYTD